jgi:uncharacterized membrane protein YqaE (UPF0057 family)
MLRAMLVAATGLILSGILAATGTLFVLRHTDFGKLMTGGSSGFADPWQVLMSGTWVLFFCVALPTVAVVSIFVGLLTKTFSRTAAAIAVLPVSVVVASGFQLRTAWVSLLLLFVGFVLAVFSQRLVRSRVAAS